ncbi:hypothetical protein L7F22_000086 [Adiantum nelumboides]|nr:hypothetical protein [Adiantum nelumboides]
MSVLAPCPNTAVAPGIDWDRVGPAYAEELFGVLADRGLVDPSAQPSWTRMWTPQDWAAAGMAAGTPFSASHTLAQTGPFRPRNLVRGTANAVLAGTHGHDDGSALAPAPPPGGTRTGDAGPRHGRGRAPAARTAARGPRPGRTARLPTAGRPAAGAGRDRADVPRLVRRRRDPDAGPGDRQLGAVVLALRPRRDARDDRDLRRPGADGVGVGAAGPRRARPSRRWPRGADDGGGVDAADARHGAAVHPRPLQLPRPGRAAAGRVRPVRRRAGHHGRDLHRQRPLLLAGHPRPLRPAVHPARAGRGPAGRPERAARRRADAADPGHRTAAARGGAARADPAPRRAPGGRAVAGRGEPGDGRAHGRRGAQRPAGRRPAAAGGAAGAAAAVRVGDRRRVAGDGGEGLGRDRAAVPGAGVGREAVRRVLVAAGPGRGAVGGRVRRRVRRRHLAHRSRAGLAARAQRPVDDRELAVGADRVRSGDRERGRDVRR